MIMFEKHKSHTMIIFYKTFANHMDIFRFVLLILFFSVNCIVFCIIPLTTELGMKDLTIHFPLLDCFSYLTINGDRGDLAEFGKKTQHRS